MSRSLTFLSDVLADAGQSEVGPLTGWFDAQITSSAQVGPIGLAAVLASGGSLSVATTYYYVVTATNGSGETVGREVSATPSSGSQSVALSWAQQSGATGYKVYRGTSASGENLLVQTVASGSTLTWTDTGAAGSAAVPPASNTAGIGTWLYAWTEQQIDPATGALVAADSPRSGTVAIEPAVEINNNSVSAPAYVAMRLRGVTGDGALYEFDAGQQTIPSAITVTDGTSSASGNTIWFEPGPGANTTTWPNGIGAVIVNSAAGGPTVNLQYASASNAGLMSTGIQAFAGSKTFEDGPVNVVSDNLVLQGFTTGSAPGIALGNTAFPAPTLAGTAADVYASIYTAAGGLDDSSTGGIELAYLHATVAFRNAICAPGNDGATAYYSIRDQAGTYRDGLWATVMFLGGMPYVNGVAASSLSYSGGILTGYTTGSSGGSGGSGSGSGSGSGAGGISATEVHKGSVIAGDSMSWEAAVPSGSMIVVKLAYKTGGGAITIEQPPAFGPAFLFEAPNSVNLPDSSWNLSLWYLAAGGTGNFTMSFSANTDAMWLIEYVSGLSSNAIDQTASNSGTSSTATSGSITTTVASEFITAAVLIKDSVANFTWGTWSGGFTADQQEPVGDGSDMVGLGDGDDIASVTGTYQATVSSLSATPPAWCALIASFK